MKQKKLSYDGRIDLHEMTQSESFEALQTFFEYHLDANSRLLLIITGRSGVLREHVPRWLELNPLFNQHISQMKLNANKGSYTVRLKK